MMKSLRTLEKIKWDLTPLDTLAKEVDRLNDKVQRQDSKIWSLEKTIKYYKTQK